MKMMIEIGSGPQAVRRSVPCDAKDIDATLAGIRFACGATPGKETPAAKDGGTPVSVTLDDSPVLFWRVADERLAAVRAAAGMKAEKN